MARVAVGPGEGGLVKPRRTAFGHDRSRYVRALRDDPVRRDPLERAVERGLIALAIVGLCAGAGYGVAAMWVALVR